MLFNWCICSLWSHEREAEARLAAVQKESLACGSSLELVLFCASVTILAM